jgi:uncharacterized protein YycO
MTNLARFSSGRGLLHLIASSRDRCVRFLVGREVTKPHLVAMLPALFARMQARLIDKLVNHLTAPINGCIASTTADPRSLASTLDRGDVLLTEGNTRAAAYVKRLTRSRWSHVAMYVGPLEGGADPLCIVEADIAQGVRSLRLSEMNALRVCVLQPVRLTDADRCRLADWVVSQIGNEYDLAHLLRLSLPMGLRPSPCKATSRTKRFICCSLLSHAFALVGCPILPMQRAGVPEWAVHANLTPGDFEHAEVFETVRRSI